MIYCFIPIAFCKNTFLNIEHLFFVFFKNSNVWICKNYFFTVYPNFRKWSIVLQYIFMALIYISIHNITLQICNMNLSFVYYFTAVHHFLNCISWATQCAFNRCFAKVRNCFKLFDIFEPESCRKVPIYYFDSRSWYHLSQKF